LYITLVEQYLTGIETFTYEDLRRLAANGFIYWRWQEEQWRLLICQRPENRNTDPPEYFVTQARNNPFRGQSREPDAAQQGALPDGPAAASQRPARG